MKRALIPAAAAAVAAALVAAAVHHPAGRTASEVASTSVVCVDRPAADTAALQAAITAAEKARRDVSIAAGVCALDAHLVVDHPVTITGPQTGTADLVQHADANIVEIAAPGVTVEYLTLDTATYNATAPVKKSPDPGVLYSGQSDTTVAHVILYAGSGFGMRLTGPQPCANDVDSGDVVTDVNATTTGTGGFVSVDVDCQSGAKVSGLVIHGGAVGLYQDRNTSLTGETFTPGPDSITCAPPWMATGPSSGMTVADVVSAGGYGREINGPQVTVTGQTMTNPACAAKPAPAAAPAPSAAPAPATYTVKAGDTLSAIAAAHGLSWPGLCAANGLPDCNQILPGQILVLRTAPVPAGQLRNLNPGPVAPRPGSAPPPAPRPAPAPAPRPPSPSYCSQALAYLAAHAAPGFTFSCGPGASEALCHSSGAVGCTYAVGAPGGVTGQIAIDSNCPSLTSAQNESSNSYRLSGRSNAPVDPYGPALC